MTELSDRPLCGVIGAAFPKANCNVSQLPPLTLAYIGDTVYDLYVRTGLVTGTTLPARGLHTAAAGRVCAKAQAEAYRAVQPLLSEEEEAVFRRGRNAHMGTVPKHAAIADYRAATGLEALLGYLYLSGRDERLTALMRHILDNREEE